MTINIVVNKKSYNSAELNDYLKVFTEYGLTYKVFESMPSELEKLITECIKDKERILIGGGDGTIRTAAQICAKSDIKIGIIPLGTFNHLAKESGLPLNPTNLAEAIIKGKTVTIDIAEVNNVKFVNNSSIGVYPKFVLHKDHSNSVNNTWINRLIGVIKSYQSNEIFDIHIKNTNFNTNLRTDFLLISNNLYDYQFPLHIHRQSFQKGILGIYALKKSRTGFMNFLNAIFKRNNFIMEQTSDHIEINIKNHKSLLVALDGEALTLELPLIYRSIPSSLTLITD